MQQTQLRIGLISDTHMPQRWEQLPDSLADIFAGVDLILHAGDLGELWVLDALSKIAPVVAVHGNDETAEATAALPYHQTLGSAGHRILLTHSHYPDRIKELESRKDDRWAPKLARFADMAQAQGASIFIYGHTHIPMAHQHESGVLMINPGGIASGGFSVEQRIQTVALLTLEAGAAPEVTHIDLSTCQPHQPQTDWSVGFKASAAPYTSPIFTTDVMAEAGWLGPVLWDPAYLEESVEALLPSLQDRWQGRRGDLNAEDLVRLLRAHGGLPRRLFDRLAQSPVFAPLLST